MRSTSSLRQSGICTLRKRVSKVMSSAPCRTDCRLSGRDARETVLLRRGRGRLLGSKPSSPHFLAGDLGQMVGKPPASIGEAEIMTSVMMTKCMHRAPGRSPYFKLVTCVGPILTVITMPTTEGCFGD